MSVTLTTNYGLKKTDAGTELDAWGPNPNYNFDIIDGQLKTNADAIAAASSVAANSVDNTKLANMPSNTIKGCITAGDPVDLTAAQVSTILGLSGTIADGSVTNAKLANMPANTLKGVSVAGVPTDLTVAQVNSMLGASGSTTMVEHALTSSHNLEASDAGKMVTFNSGSTCTCTVNSSVFPADSWVEIIQLGSGAVVFGGTATKRALAGANRIAGQYGHATVWFVSASEYVLYGDVSV